MPALFDMTVYFGFSKKRLKHMENVAMFAADYMGIDAYMSALNVAQVDGLPDNHQGLCLANGTILLQKQTIKKQTSAFFHELVHYAQFCEGRLTDNFFIDADHKGVTFYPYLKASNAPHEVEANLYEESLLISWERK